MSNKFRFFLSLSSILMMFLLNMNPLRGQLRFQDILRATPQSRLQFSPYTVGSVISGAGDRLYLLNAKKGQVLRVIVTSTGARAFVSVFDAKGKELATLTDQSQPLEYTLPAAGKYYIFCYSGPTLHFYDLTVRVD